MTDVAQGDEDFSWSGLASNMIEGGLDGAWSAGASRLTGGLGTKLRGGSGGRTPGVSSRAAGEGGPGSSAAQRPRSQESSSSGPGCSTTQRHSFDPATPVLMANGNTKPIEDVEVGDEVATTDPATGESTPQKVTYRHVNVDDDLTDVTVRDGETGTTSVVKTTAHHPFWDATDGRWVDAAQLTPGHRLLVHDDKRLEGDSTGAGMGGGGPGHTVTVVQVTDVDGSKTMRDLTVDNTHTYYVLAGDEPVLVHNCNGPDCTCGPSATELRSTPGVAGGSGASVGVGNWLRGSHGNAGVFPSQVADRLRGRSFDTFNDFRGEFWKEVGTDADPSAGFSPANVARMQNGNSPFVATSQQFGPGRNYVLHHVRPIQHGGGVYDMDNLVVVTPLYHSQILKPSYHYGNG